METLTKPQHLRICLILMVVTLIYELINVIVFQIPTVAAHGNIKINDFAIYAVALVFTAPFGFLVYKIHKARAWARIVWSLLIIFGFLVGLSSKFDYEKHPAILAFINTIIAVADIVVLVLLWHPSTTRWLKAMKMARFEAAIPITVETMESQDKASKNTHSGISYKSIIYLVDRASCQKKNI